MLSLILWVAACGSAVGGTDHGAGGGDEPRADDVDGGTSGREGGADAGQDATAADAAGDGSASEAGSTHALKTVFVIMMENHSLSTIAASPHAKYLNETLVPMGGHAENYSTPKGNHPSERNYIWLESGDNLGITTDDDPSVNHRATTDHLVTKLEEAGITWKAYVEDISGDDCPLTSSGKFVTRHVPMLFFDDVTNTNDPSGSKCKTHIRPYAELAGDLTASTVAQYNFITPNLCDDMHGLTVRCGMSNFDEIGAGDAWLQAEVPKILASDAYKNGGVLFIVWDEGDEAVFSDASDGPLPFIVLSPFAKKGYTSQTTFTHSSTLRTMQEIFGVKPLLRDAANATDLSEFFTQFP